MAGNNAKEASSGGNGGYRLPGVMAKKTQESYDKDIDFLKRRWNVEQVADAFPESIRPQNIGLSCLKYLRSIAIRFPDFTEVQKLFIKECKDPMGQPVPLGFTHTEKVFKTLKANESAGNDGVLKTKTKDVNSKNKSFETVSDSKAKAKTMRPRTSGPPTTVPNLITSSSSVEPTTPSAIRKRRCGSVASMPEGETGARKARKGEGIGTTRIARGGESGGPMKALPIQPKELDQPPTLSELNVFSSGLPVGADGAAAASSPASNKPDIDIYARLDRIMKDIEASREEENQFDDSNTIIVDYPFSTAVQGLDSLCKTDGFSGAPVAPMYTCPKAQFDIENSKVGSDAGVVSEKVKEYCQNLPGYIRDYLQPETLRILGGENDPAVVENINTILTANARHLEADLEWIFKNAKINKTEI